MSSYIEYRDPKSNLAGLSYRDFFPGIKIDAVIECPDHVGTFDATNIRSSVGDGGTSNDATCTVDAVPGTCTTDVMPEGTVCVIGDWLFACARNDTDN